MPQLAIRHCPAQMRRHVLRAMRTLVLLPIDIGVPLGTPKHTSKVRRHVAAITAHTAPDARCQRHHESEKPGAACRAIESIVT